MLSIREYATVEDASNGLLDFILEPRNWVSLENKAGLTPGQNPAYHRRVGNLRIYASIDVTSKLDVFFRVAFRAPDLSPMKAADHLEALVKKRVPFVPNTEWQVKVDSNQWIHFIRRYTGDTLRA
jgi:hypothetical protein